MKGRIYEKHLKALMVIGIITLGMNLAQAKTQAAEQTTVPQETTAVPETTTPKAEEPTNEQPTTKPNVDTTGKSVKRWICKEKVYAYNLKLEKVTKLKKVCVITFIRNAILDIHIKR
ncbi:MAG: hypothetical protein ACLT2Z_07810 [Eubacterium sp.]